MNRHKQSVLFMSLLSLGLLTAAGHASTISFTGPSLPIIGDPLEFKIFGLQLTQPSGSNTDWVLTVETNYGVTLPGNTDVIPTFSYNGIQYGMGDLLITWNGVDYGVVLSAHDSYSAGDLYKVSSFQTSGDVMGIDSPRKYAPVLIGTGGTLQGAGTVAAAKTGDGTNTALYTVTDEFSAPAGFLGSGDFTIDMSSYVCANGFLTGTGSFDGNVPEPGTFALMLPALLLLPIRRRFAARRN